MESQAYEPVFYDRTGSEDGERAVNDVSTDFSKPLDAVLIAPLEPDGGGMDWVASSKKDQREAGQVKQSAVWNLHDSHLWKACLRRQYWDWQCSEIISDLVEKDILSTRSEIMACWGREPLICWRVRIPPRGTWTDWRNGKTETSRSYD